MKFSTTLSYLAENCTYPIHTPWGLFGFILAVSVGMVISYAFMEVKIPFIQKQVKALSYSLSAVLGFFAVVTAIPYVCVAMFYGGYEFAVFIAENVAYNVPVALSILALSLAVAFNYFFILKDDRDDSEPKAKKFPIRGFISLMIIVLTPLIAGVVRYFTMGGEDSDGWSLAASNSAVILGTLVLCLGINSDNLDPNK